VRETKAFLEATPSLAQVRLVCFGNSALQIHCDALNATLCR
jgi:hypothetical protein